MSAKLLIFDWDGTLCDSLSRISQCLQLAAVDLGLTPPDPEDAKQIVGLSLADVLSVLFPDVDAAGLQALSENYSRHFVELDAEPSPFFPEVEASLQLFRERGHRLTVATGKSRRGLDRVFRARGLTEFFHGSRCADETASKPNPRMLLELLDEFDMKPEEALMIGDTAFDMEMAERANVPRIAVAYGAHAPEQMTKYKPLLCAGSFSEVRDYIIKLL